LGLRGLVCLSLAAIFWAGSVYGRSVALTFDDGPNMTDEVKLSPADRNAAILRQLADAHVKSILFVTRTDADPARSDLIRQWGIEGHEIANHTATHPNFDDVPLEDFEHELLTCENAIQSFPGFTRRFRFPYLKEGDTVEKRDGFRAFLDAHAYKSGAVSIDASDWYYSQRLSERLKKEPDARLAPYKEAYLRHLYDRAEYYDGLSRRILGRSVIHVLLLHHNLINALFLSDVIHAFQARGWKVVDAEVAFADPVYALRPDTLPAGESILWALAKEKGIPGLRWPGEDGRYEKPLLDRLRL
jgi:peptidoglycan-N-acetylglucosamine deacetylase